MSKETEKKIFEILDQLENLPRGVLIKIGYHLNKYEWIEELPGKPENWEAMNFEEKHKIVSCIRSNISVNVGEKALLRYAHKRKYGISDQEFDDWWDSGHCGLTEEKYEELRNSYERRHNRRDKQAFVYPVNSALLFFFLGAFSSAFLLFLIHFYTFVC